MAKAYLNLSIILLLLGKVSIVPKYPKVLPYVCVIPKLFHKADDKTLRRLGITYEQIADRLEYLMTKARQKGESGERLVDGKFKVYAIFLRGTQKCPFFYEERPSKGGIGTHVFYTCGSGCGDFVVINEKQQREISFPELMPHLVREHHFFEGATPYRMDPEHVAKVLELEPNIDNTCKKIKIDSLDPNN